MESPYRDGAPDVGVLRSVHVERSNVVLAAVLAVPTVCLVAWALFLGVPTSILVAMALVAAAGIVVLGWISRRRPGARIELHEHGLVVRTREGARVVRFDDVVAVTSSAVRRRAGGVESERHVVTTREPPPIEFSLLHDRAPALLAAIHAGTRERLRGEALRAYDAGETVRFGPLAISEEGIRDGNGAVVPWRQIDRATIDMPVFAMGETFSQVKVWKNVASAPLVSYASKDVPNAALLVEIVALAIAAEDDDAEQA